MGIFVNIVRWTMLALSLRNMPIPRLLTAIRILIGVLVLLGVSMVISSTFYEHFPDRDPKEAFFKYYSLLVIPAIPIPCYLILYCSLNDTYKRLLAENAKDLSSMDREAINQALSQTIFFFAAIAQFCIFTIINTSLNIFTSIDENVEAELAMDVLLSLSECLMQVALCLSINRALQTLQDKAESVADDQDKAESVTDDQRTIPVDTEDISTGFDQSTSLFIDHKFPQGGRLYY